MAETKTKTQLPAWYEDAAKDLIALGKKRSTLGYVPYLGPDVAAITPQQEAGIKGYDAMSSAFGMPAGGAQALSYLPQATEFAGGVKGYSSFPGFEQSMKALKAKYPGIYDYLQSFSVNNRDTGISFEQALNPPAPSPGTPPVISPPSGGGSGGGGSGSFRPGSDQWWSVGGSGVGWQSPDQPIGPILTRPGGNNTLGGKGVAL